MFRAFGSNKGRNGLFRLGLVVFTLIFCATIFFSGSLFGQETTSTESGDNSSGMSLEWVYWGLVLAASFAALIQARMFYTGMKEADEGTDRMQEIAGFVREGATAYLKQQYKVVSIFMVIVALLLLWAGIAGVQERWVWLAFLTGGFWSGLAGFIGMKTATQASNRTAAGAQTSLNDGLQVAFRSGAVMGLTVVGLGMLDMSFWYLVLSFVYGDLETGMIINTMLCSLMGASSQALFARVGGGIFTKAADVGADLVGKVEKNIPEDDPRNPATIADNVGDNVGDVAGMGADLRKLLRFNLGNRGSGSCCRCIECRHRNDRSDLLASIGGSLWNYHFDCRNLSRSSRRRRQSKSITWGAWFWNQHGNRWSDCSRIHSFHLFAWNENWNWCWLQYRRRFGRRLVDR